MQVRGAIDNIAGVKIPKLKSFVQPGDTKMDMTGARPYSSVFLHPRLGAMGVQQVPRTSCQHSGAGNMCAAALAGLGRGGQQVQSCKKAYVKAVELLVQLANLQVGAGARGRNQGLGCRA